jgi:large conductance mechanosensitive channel
VTRESSPIVSQAISLIRHASIVVLQPGAIALREENVAEGLNCGTRAETVRRWTMLKEFREFAMRGSMLDLAIGIIMGVAFGGVVNSLVNDVIMPPIGALLGKVDFSSLFFNLSGQTFPSLKAAKDAGAPVIGYGAFLNTVINFLVIAFVVFQIVKAVNRMQKPAPAAGPATKDCPHCTMSIPIKARRCPHCTSELK